MSGAPKRLAMIHLLRDREHTVGELVAALGVRQPNVSQHLNVMRDAGLVATRREGTTIFYRLAYPRIVEACEERPHRYTRIVVEHAFRGPGLSRSCSIGCSHTWSSRRGPSDEPTTPDC